MFIEKDRFLWNYIVIERKIVKKEKTKFDVYLKLSESHFQL